MTQPGTKPLKIFELRFDEAGGKAWVAATSNLHAVDVYCRTTGTAHSDFSEGDEIVELPESKWASCFVIDEWGDMDYEERMELDLETCEKKSLSEWMKENSHPDIIAIAEP